MKKILKFPLVLGQYSVVMMPKGSAILDVDHQKGELYVWAMCDPDQPLISYSFRIHGTGFELPNVHEYEKWYFKTVHIHEQGLVWHVFDLNRNVE
jgi:hypothetical protein